MLEKKNSSIFENSRIIEKQRGGEWAYSTCSTLKPEQQELERRQMHRWQPWISYTAARRERAEEKNSRPA